MQIFKVFPVFIWEFLKKNSFLSYIFLLCHVKCELPQINFLFDQLNCSDVYQGYILHTNKQAVMLNVYFEIRMHAYGLWRERGGILGLENVLNLL